MASTPRWIRLGAVLLVAAAAGLRAYMYAVGAANVPVTSDEALTVLQAVDIRNGHFPLLMAGQPYMFPVEAYWMAPLEPFLPRTAYGMRVLILLEGFAIAALGLWILRRMGRWREVWPGALAVLFPSAYVLTTQTAYSMPYYASPAILALLAAGCFAVADPPRGNRGGSLRKENAWAFFGAFSLGMAVSNSLAAMGLAVPLAVVALWNAAGRRPWRAVAWRLGALAGGVFLGLFPHLLSRWFIPHAHEAVSSMYPLGEALPRVWKAAIAKVLPGTFGIQPGLWPDSDNLLEGSAWLPQAFAWGAIAVFAVALALAVARMLREGLRERRWPLAGPFEWSLVVSAASVVLFSLNQRAASCDFRYLLPVAVVSPFLLAGLCQRLQYRILRWGLGAAVAVFSAYNVATALRLAEVWKEPGFALKVVSVPDLGPALEVLRERDIHHAVASHWAAYRIGFEAGGDVVCSQPFNERFPGWPLPYKAEVDAADDVAYVLTDAIRFLKPEIFERHMKTMQIEADIIPAGEFRVYCNFRKSGKPEPQALPADRFRISANNAPERAPAMVDGDVGTYWRCFGHQTNGIAVECEFDEPVPLAGVRLQYGTFGHDRPTELGIEVRRRGTDGDGGSVWTPVVPDQVVREPFLWQNEHPVYSKYSSDRFEFPVQEDAEAVRISIVRPNPRWAWTLCEVEPLVEKERSTEEEGRSER